ncbi:MAG: proteasome subunit alpha [Opitutaceae bacterium]
MNGDFLALLPKSPFAAAQAGGPHPPGLEATTVFAFHCAAGVIVAGDHRATAGNIIFSDRTEKILELDRHSLLAIAGNPAIAMEMARTLQTSFDFYRRSQLQPMSLPAKMRALARLLHDNLPATLQGFGHVAPIFAGADGVEGSRPSIYFYDPLGAQFEAAAFAGSGSGAGSIKSILHFLEQWGDPKPGAMPLEHAVTLANQLLMTAAEYDTATGGVDPGRGIFATVKLLSAAGVRPIPAGEQAGYWKENAR